MKSTLSLLGGREKNRIKAEKNIKKLLSFSGVCDIIFEPVKRPLGQEVKTTPSHGVNMGSIPVGVTIKHSLQLNFGI